VRVGENLSGMQIFPADNWWNVDVSAAPIDAKSASYMGVIGAGQNWCHFDGGGCKWGIPYVTVGATQPLVTNIQWTWPALTDTGAPGRPAGFPIPEEAKSVAGFIQGCVAGGGPVNDRHMIIIDRDQRLLYELYGVEWKPELNKWDIGCGAVWDMKTNDRRRDNLPSADAAGLQIYPGLIKYDEVFGDKEIAHAHRVTLAGNDSWVWPASHGYTSYPGWPPYGTRMRLKANFDISSYPAPAQRLLRSFKKYGLIVADLGGNMFVTGTADARWDALPVQLDPNYWLSTLHTTDFEVVQLEWGKPGR
jgi:hypothetical protein